MVSIGPYHCPSIMRSVDSLWVGHFSFTAFVASVNEEIFTKNDHSARAIRRVRDANQLMGCFRDYIT